MTPPKLQQRPKLPIAVEKPTPYTFDLGLLLAQDPNTITLKRQSSSSPSTTTAPPLEQSLAEITRDGAQSLINQLLTTCPITSTRDGVLLSLPPPTTPLPREKPLPPAKQKTKWERFAEKKGIAPKTREQRRNLAYDATSGEWKRKWGYGGLNKKGENDPIIEVDMKKEAERKEGTSIRGDGRRDRKERIKRNERKMRKNQRDAGGSLAKR